MNSNTEIEKIIKQWAIPSHWSSQICVLLEKIRLDSFSSFITDNNEKNRLIEILENFVVIDNLTKINIENNSKKRIILIDTFNGKSKEGIINEAMKYLERVLVEGIAEIIYPNWGDTPLDLIEIVFAMLDTNGEMGEKLPRHNRWPLRGLYTLKIKRICQALGKLSCNVLITGPSGVGKEAIARLIHAYSDCSGQFVSISVPSIPGELFASVLFGYQKGAYTDARHNQEGYFEKASNGTLFMDEIADIGPIQQASLLRILSERKGMTIDGTREFPINCRVITATNRLDKLRNNFRADLRIRLAEQEISYASDNNDWHPIKSLTMIPEQIPLLFAMQLARSFHEQIGFGTRVGTFSLSDFVNMNSDTRKVLESLSSYSWPMNFRELSYVALHALLRAIINNEDCFSSSHITKINFIIKMESRYDIQQKSLSLNISDLLSFLETIPEHEKKWDYLSNYIRKEVIRCLKNRGFNDSRCAEYLGIDRSSFSRFLIKNPL